MAKGLKKVIKHNNDIVRDYSLMCQINNHIHVYGFASAVDNLVAACEDKVAQWQQRLGKAQKLRKTLGDNFGRN